MANLCSGRYGGKRLNPEFYSSFSMSSALLISSALTVFLPACFVSMIASFAIFIPILSRISVRAPRADSLTRMSPSDAVRMSRSTGASGIIFFAIRLCLLVWSDLVHSHDAHLILHIDTKHGIMHGIEPYSITISMLDVAMYLLFEISPINTF